MDEGPAGPWPAADVSPAGWIAESIAPFASGVGALVPPGFASYARILHPAASPQGDPVTWTAAAGWSGGTPHALAQFAPMTRPRRESDDPPPFDEEPHTGELVPPVLAALCEVLAAHTATADHCWFCVWDGWTYSAPSALASRRRVNGGAVEAVPFPPEAVAAARLRLPHRDYVVCRGRLADAADIGYRVGAGSFVAHTPNLFWPDDRAWCVATEVDLDSTYVGGSDALVQGLLADPRLEVWRVAVTDPITADSDRINR